MKEVTPGQLKAAEAEWRKANPGKEPTAQDISGQAYQSFYNQAFSESGFGTGGRVQQAIQAATAAVQGLAGGNLAQAITGGSAPYLAEVIHNQTLNPDGSVNVQANLMAHAVVGAVTAYAAGNSAVAGAQEGKSTVKNNLLGGNEESQTAWIRQHGIDMASCADAPGSANCQKAINQRDAVGLALATGSVALLPGGAQAMWGLGAGANAGISYLADGTIDPANAAIAGWVNVLSMGNGLAGTVGWNAAGGALGNWLDDKDPLSGAITNGVGAGFGYGIGKGISWGANTGTNLWKGGWDPKFNPTLQKYTEIKGEFGISKEMKPGNIPSSFCDLGGSVFSEVTGKGIEKISSPSSNGDKK